MASSHLNSGDIRDPLIASGSFCEHRRRIPEGEGQHQCSSLSHSSDYIEGIWASCRKVPGFVVAELECKGINRKTLRKMPIRRANIVWCGVNHFEFGAKGRSPWTYENEQVFVILVRDAFGNAVDIVAWDLETNHIGTWLGVAYALGQASVLAGHLSAGLPVHRTPLNYLRAAGKGIVILNASTARSYLIDAGPLIAEDAKHRRELTTALAQPLPRILVAPAASKEG
jgi:hypothetical protein